MYLPKITIVTVVYNRVDTIEQTISSVVNQTYPNLEYIVIDGGSTDGTIDIIKKYEKDIAYWITEKDSGVYDAMNKGVQAATGDYIEFIGSDDCLCSYDIVAKVAEAIDDETDILSCPIYGVDETYCTEIISDNCFAKDKNTYRGGMIPHPGMFTRRELLRKYPFDTKYKIVSDYKFFLMCYYDDNVRFKFVDFPVVYFSHGGLSSTVDTTQERLSMYNELGLGFSEDEKDILTRWKSSLREMLIYMHLYTVLHELIWLPIHHSFMRKHHCDNIICRWCGRSNESKGA